jgi:hypothetical protein
MRRIEPVRRELARAADEPERGFSYYVRSLTTVQLAQDTTEGTRRMIPRCLN